MVIENKTRNGNSIENGENIKEPALTGQVALQPMHFVVVPRGGKVPPPLLA